MDVILYIILAIVWWTAAVIAFAIEFILVTIAKISRN